MVLQATGSSGAFGTSTETVVVTNILTSTTTTTTTFASSIPYNESGAAIITAFDNRLLNMQSSNYTGIMGGYRNNVTLQVKVSLSSGVNPISAGDAEGLSGNYVGSLNASLFVTNVIGSLFNHGDNMTMIVLNFNIQNLGNDVIGKVDKTAATNSTISLTGFGVYLGHTSATIIMQTNYVQAGGLWLISDETWTITNYADQAYLNIIT